MSEALFESHRLAGRRVGPQLCLKVYNHGGGDGHFLAQPHMAERAVAT